jgi:hypothetical protein
MAQKQFVNACAFTPTAGGSGTWTVSAAITGYMTPANAGAVDGASYSYRAESADKSQWEIGVGTYTASGTTLSRTPSLSSNSNAAVSFSSAPNIYLTALAEDISRYTDWMGSTALVGTRQWNTSFSSYNATSISTGTIHYVPVPIKKAFSSLSIHVNLTALNVNAGTVFALGIYDNLNGQPNNRLAQATGLNGSTTGGATGDNSSGTLTLASTQPPGVYWLAYVCAVAVPTIEVAAAAASSWLMREIVGATDTTDLTVTPKSYTQSNATLPTTAGSLSLNSGVAPYLGVNC